MVTDKLLEYCNNPNHKRSVLVLLSEHGKEVYNTLREVQDPWAIDATDDIPTEELEVALRLVQRLIKKFN